MGRTYKEDKYGKYKNLRDKKQKKKHKAKSFNGQDHVKFDDIEQG